MTYKEYWKESVESSLNEHGLCATTEQIEAIAGDMQVCAEMKDMAFGHDVASSNYSKERESRIRELEQQLSDEKRKVSCHACKGKGYIVECYGTFSSEMTCFTCKGEGRI